MSAACFAREGHEVVGVDVSIIKTQIINQGNSPIVETSIAEIISQSVSSGCLRATTDSTVAIQHSDISLVCVGSNSNGSLDLRYVICMFDEGGAGGIGEIRTAQDQASQSLVLRGEGLRFSLLNSAHIPVSFLKPTVSFLKWPVSLLK